MTPRPLGTPIEEIGPDWEVMKPTTISARAGPTRTVITENKAKIERRLTIDMANSLQVNENKTIRTGVT